jgi:hypothetical protein
MFTAASNALAFRFGGLGHGGGFGFVVLFLILAGVVVWALSSSGTESQKS